jgi:membrane protease YdiL (CAAX protease family)
VKAERWVLAFAMVLPTAAAAFYFVGLSAESNGERATNPLLQFAYTGSKSLQFAIPIIWLAFADRAALRPPRLPLRGVNVGVLFGLAAAALILALYRFKFAGSPRFEGVGDRIRAKVSEFGAGTPFRFLALAAFLCVIHSLLEEYYWRWFVFGRLRRHIPWGLALVLAGLAFMAHHVVVIWVYFPDQFWSAVLPFSLGVAAGGMVWAWIYERSGSLLGPWLSHLIVDAALMTVGYELMFGSP